MLLTLIFFIFYLALIMSFGNLLVSQVMPACKINNKENPENPLLRLSLCIITGLASFILFSHLLSYLSQSFRVSSYIVAFVFLVFIVIFKKQLQCCKVEKIDWIIIALALVFAYLCAYRGYLTDSDNVHMAWLAGIAENNIYPPVLSTNMHYSRSFYHYGVDLSCAAIRILTGAQPWHALSMHVFIGAFLSFVSIYNLIFIFLKNKVQSLVSSFVICTYTSFMGFEFFFKYSNLLSQMSFKDFLSKWQVAALGSTQHLPYFAVLPSQSIGLSALLSSISLILHHYCSSLQGAGQSPSLRGAGQSPSLRGAERRGNPSQLSLNPANISFYFLLTSISFLAYFHYPSYWYPSFAGILLFLAFNYFKAIANKETSFLKLDFYLFNPALIALAFFLGKLLTLKHGFTEFGGINALIFKPSLYWDSFNMNSLYFFDFNFQTEGIRAVRDYVSGKAQPEVHLLNLHSFRNFGFELILATAFAFYRLIAKKIDKSFLLYIIGLIALPIPFLFDFVLKPPEIGRFLAWMKFIFIIFVLISFWQLFVDTNKRNQMIKIVSLLLCLPILIPGFISVLPGFRYIEFLPTDLLSASQKLALTEMIKVHKNKEKALTNIHFYNLTDMTALAGFYGVGGQVYKPDKSTRLTAVKTLNPLLLKELDVDYILLSSQDPLLPLARERLKNNQLFQELASVREFNPSWLFLKFNKDYQPAENELAELKEEYKWLVGSKSGWNFMPLASQEGLMLAQTKLELDDEIELVKDGLKDSNKVLAVWLAAQALTKAELEQIKL